MRTGRESVGLVALLAAALTLPLCAQGNPFDECDDGPQTFALVWHDDRESIIDALFQAYPELEDAGVPRSRFRDGMDGFT
ncbi:MAG: hypothetical protein RI542_09060, partial [Wenzhouxiangella sp.]|nr:hypothetical protein [Wenzhouxiangella sp.]